MDTIQAIQKRRAVNYFDNSFKMTDKEITELLEIASLAPSSYNIQPWEVIVVRSEERKKVLKECSFNQPKIQDASAVLIFIGNTDAQEENLDAVARDLVDKGYADLEAAEAVKNLAANFYGTPDSERRRLFASKNIGLIAMSFMITAEAKGYSTHPMDGFEEDKIKAAFGIKAGKTIPLIVAVGKLDSTKPQLPKKMRFSPGRFAKFE